MRSSEVLGISSSTYAKYRKEGNGEIPEKRLRYISKYPRANKHYFEWEDALLMQLIERFGGDTIAFIGSKKFSAKELDALEAIFRVSLSIGRTFKAVRERLYDIAKGDAP